MAYRVYIAGDCQFCGTPLGEIEQDGGRDRCYCSSRCRQAAYRKRKREKRHTGVLRKDVEASTDMRLHPLSCGCGRTIFAVYGNVTIGHLRCTLCNTDFEVKG